MQLTQWTVAILTKSLFKQKESSLSNNMVGQNFDKNVLVSS